MSPRCITCGDAGLVTFRHGGYPYSQPCPDCWGLTNPAASSPGGRNLPAAAPQEPAGLSIREAR